MTFGLILLKIFKRTNKLVKQNGMFFQVNNKCKHQFSTIGLKIQVTVERINNQETNENFIMNNSIRVNET